MANRQALIIGCGHRKELAFKAPRHEESYAIVTLDQNPDVHPDCVHDLDILPYPFPDNTFDIIEAIEVLEHIGGWGQWHKFFAQFSELWRILKPNGELRASCPAWNSLGAAGDPGHCRIINDMSLAFLSQAEYIKQVDKGLSTMTDYRHWYNADFEAVHTSYERECLVFVLKAIKPPRSA